MTASIGDWAGDLIQELGYAGLVVLMAVEHVFPPIPSELVLPLAGFEVGRGNLSLAGALAASTAGSLIGATLLYLLARKGGRPLVLKLRRVLHVGEEDLDRAEQRFRRHSAWMVVLGRMVPGLRSLVSLPPGLLKMPFGRYLALTLTGSLVWNSALIIAGQQLGSRWSQVGGIVGPVAQWVVVATIPLTLAAILVRQRRRAAGGGLSGHASTPPTPGGRVWRYRWRGGHGEGKDAWPASPTPYRQLRERIESGQDPI